MLPQIKLFDSVFLSSLVQEFRASMRGLVFDLCDDLRAHYQRPAAALRLPVDYFRFVGNSLKQEDYSSWKVVGWIEELNDLVYFVDLREQLRRERHLRPFAAELFAACEETFYEHSYLGELFPRGKPESAGLERRLSGLCMRLAQQVTQESLFLVPGLPCRWLASRRGLAWTAPYDFGPNFERVESAGHLYVGLDSTYLELPAPVRRELAKRAFKATLLIREKDIRLRVGRLTTTVLNAGDQLRWGWRHVRPVFLKAPNPRWPAGLALGPTLVYSRRDRVPIRVAPTRDGLTERIQKALAVIETAWPDGAKNLACLTSRIVPLNAKGVVSFSYRHRPGLSFINCFDRDDLDLIDDLIHENSHHHLNLLLRKYILYRRDRNREIFYSPWRRSLRPLHGILHATSTFTMGAILFERLSSWATTGKATLTDQQVLRARFRCLEEVESVRYSLKDLGYARKLSWLTSAGWALVSSLKREIERVKKKIAPFEATVLRSHYRSELKRHQNELAAARRTYGPVRN